ncbi:MAG: hypothetical protein JJ992_11770, partial [Planctomycetes bacterium]|nr:hypothetical protein [Planctomycetota bacterium]
MFAQLWSSGNPDPTRLIAWDQVAVFDNKLHLGSSLGIPFSEQLGAFRGSAPSQMSLAGDGGVTAAAGGGAAPEILELQLWRGDPLGEAELVDVLARFEALAPEAVGDPRFGRSLVVEQQADGGIVVRPTWLYGMPHGLELSDSDGDNVPDSADNCLDVPNQFQRDADHDGYGDTCDADFDQNGEVDNNELLMVQDCLGVDLTWVFPGDANEHPEDYSPHDPAIEQDIIRCEGRDLTGDRVIQADDVALAKALVGGPPGPSGLADVHLPRTNPAWMDFADPDRPWREGVRRLRDPIPQGVVDSRTAGLFDCHQTHATSPTFSTSELATIGSPLVVELRRPEVAGSSKGQDMIRAYISIPGAGIVDEYLGRQKLNHLERGAWTQVEFAVPGTVVRALEDGHDDVSIRLAVIHGTCGHELAVDRVFFRRSVDSAWTPTASSPGQWRIEGFADLLATSMETIGTESPFGLDQSIVSDGIVDFSAAFIAEFHAPDNDGDRYPDDGFYATDVSRFFVEIGDTSWDETMPGSGVEVQ